MKINKIDRLEVSTCRPRAGWVLGLALGLLGCGPAAPTLPVEAPRAAPPVGDPVRGAALLRDRGLGRSGFACVDCHPVTGPRPGPALADARWQRVDWCVERYLLRPPLPPQQTGDLIAAAPEAAPAPDLADGAAAYTAWCAHCHRDGPAGVVEGAVWSDAALRARIRGTDRPAHPDTLMPAFSPERLDDATLAQIIAHLATAARPAP